MKVGAVWCGKAGARGEGWNPEQITETREAGGWSWGSEESEPVFRCDCRSPISSLPALFDQTAPAPCGAAS